MQSRLCGLDWQRWANQLLARHYGPTEYQKVPDADRGDAGIEGFTLTNGHAYQAYGCVEPVDVRKRYENQRDKVTQDINKFINNTYKLTKIFGTVKINRWVFFVPSFDSRELVEHASKKTTEVIQANLNYTTPAFQVMIADEDQFSIERDLLTNAGSTKLELSLDDCGQEVIDEWVTGNDELVATLDRKVQMLPTVRTERDRIGFRNKLLRNFLERVMNSNRRAGLLFAA